VPVGRGRAGRVAASMSSFGRRAPVAATASSSSLGSRSSSSALSSTGATTAVGKVEASRV
jgi:hypothetical protein